MLSTEATPAIHPTFAALQDDDGSWYVNQYTPRADCTRRDTLADDLLEIEAHALANALNRVSARWWLI